MKDSCQFDTRQDNVERGALVDADCGCVCAEAVRVPLVNLGMVPPLLKLIQSQCPAAIATQVCRALGNICFDNGQFTQWTGHFVETGSLPIQRI